MRACTMNPQLFASGPFGAFAFESGRTRGLLRRRLGTWSRALLSLSPTSTPGAALGMLSQRSPRSCKACLQALRPVPVQRPASSLRSFASTSHLLSTPPSTPPPPFSSSSSPPRSPHASSLEAARTQAQRQLTSVLSTLNLSARARARAFSSALAALELERKLGQAGAKINKATGYEEIERLRKGVAERGAEVRVRAAGGGR